jgi:enoyl-CoA hydratase
MARAKPTVTYKKKDQVAWISMNRPEFNNAQNGKMTYDLDKFFKRAVDDDDVKVIVLKGNGKHFSAGHDIGQILNVHYHLCRI